MIDRNQLTGILLIMSMLLAWNYFNRPTEADLKKQQATADSLKRVEAQKAKTQIEAKTSPDSTLTPQATAGESVVLENEDIKVTLNSSGAQIRKVELKKHRAYQAFEKNAKEYLVLFNENDKIEAKIAGVDLSKISYTSQKTAEKVLFVASLPNGQTVKQSYELPAKGYAINYSISSSQPSAATLTWLENVEPTEKDIADNRIKTTINFLDAQGEFDNVSEVPSGTEEENPELALKWVALKKKYFVSGIVPQGFEFSKGNLKAEAHAENSQNIKTLTANMQLPADALSGKNMKLYFGPNDIDELEKVDDSFDKNVYLGYEIFKPINKYVFVPLFNFLEKILNNYGILIVILVLIIKLALTPLTYKSYVSMAKMKLLQPELAAIKEKVGDDAMKLQQEQMKLYQQVGVSPMSGCVPMLATLPILMSVFFLFPNLFQLRQQPFLWANDLSTFDSIIKLPFKIPFYGSHVSLFCLLMTVSQLAYGYYNNQITPQQPGQPFDMRIMNYITPVIFMFVMNSFPAGLSFYYFVSNIITVAQQLIIRKFVDNDKLQLILDENRKKIAAGGGPKKSKFSEYLQKQLNAAEEAKNVQNKNKSSNKK
jgi:YidC/Oxa1 family membrane protein insertase